MEYVYAALLLHKLGKEVTEDSIKSVVSAAGSSADESKIKSLIASLKGIDIDKELESASFTAAPAPSAGHAPAAQKKEEPKEEKHESAAEGLSALFG